jgi:hypothetical protein
LDEATASWEPPTPAPELTQEEIDAMSFYSWNEELLDWELITRQEPAPEPEPVVDPEAPAPNPEA